MTNWVSLNLIFKMTTSIDVRVTLVDGGIFPTVLNENSPMLQIFAPSEITIPMKKMGHLRTGIVFQGMKNFGATVVDGKDLMKKGIYTISAPIIPGEEISIMLLNMSNVNQTLSVGSPISRIFIQRQAILKGFRLEVFNTDSAGRKRTLNELDHVSDVLKKKSKHESKPKKNIQVYKSIGKNMDNLRNSYSQNLLVTDPSEIRKTFTQDQHKLIRQQQQNLHHHQPHHHREESEQTMQQTGQEQDQEQHDVILPPPSEFLDSSQTQPVSWTIEALNNFDFEDLLEHKF